MRGVSPVIGPKPMPPAPCARDNGAGRIGRGISQRGLSGAARPRPWARGDWNLPTCSLPGGTGDAMAPGRARLFRSMGAPGAPRSAGSWRRAGRVTVPRRRLPVGSCSPGRPRCGLSGGGEGRAPTNHAAERPLRQAGQWRKGSSGTQSEKGSRFVAHILTVVASCRQPGRKVLASLTACCQAFYAGQVGPSLLPHTSS